MNGRPPKEPSDLTARITITLPRMMIAAIDKAGTNRSATIARLLSMLPELADVRNKSRQVKK